MKILTSYFYMIRFLKPHQIPISTAIFDPEWFHDFKGNENVFIDRNGVLNGLRCECLNPWKDSSVDMDCGVDFFTSYENKLKSYGLDNILKDLGRCLEEAEKFVDFKYDPELVLIVHESPDNPNSERPVLQKLFDCREFEIQPTLF